MISENLHNMVDVACELAHRDHEIALLKEAIALLTMDIEEPI